MRQLETTFYAVITFSRRGSKMIADQPRTAKNAAEAERMALRLADSHAGVLAFSRSGDPDTGDYDDAVILARHGDVPAEALAA